MKVNQTNRAIEDRFQSIASELRVSDEEDEDQPIEGIENIRDTGDETMYLQVNDLENHLKIVDD
jgi:hypothetical protein